MVIDSLKDLFLASTPPASPPNRPIAIVQPDNQPSLGHSGLIITEPDLNLTWGPTPTTGIQGPWQPHIFPATLIQPLKSKKVIRSYLKIVLSIIQGFFIFLSWMTVPLPFFANRYV